MTDGSDVPDEGMDGGAALPEPARHKKNALLIAFGESGNLTEACKIASVGRRTHYDWLANDPEYVLQFADAQESAADYLEKVARDRATGGQDAEEMKGKTRGSDLLLIFLLKGLRPWKYRDNAKPDAEVSTSGVLEMGWEQKLALADLADAAEAEEKVRSGGS